MLPPFIIDQIRKREREENEYKQPFLELPLPEGPRTRETPVSDDAHRGVVIIDLGA